MRVLFLTHYELLLGANRSLVSLLQGLREFGVESEVWMPKSGELSEYLKTQNIDYQVAGFAEDTFVYRRLSRVKGWMRHIKNLLNINQLTKKAQKFAPDIIYSNSSVILTGARIAQRLGIPHVWHVREYGKQDYNIGYNLGSGQFTYYANQARFVISISHDLKSKRLAGLKCPVEVVYNGVGTRQKLESIPRHKQGDQAVFLILGLISPSKGQMQAIEALRLAISFGQNLKLMIVGRTGDIAYLKRLYKAARGLPIEFIGYEPDPFKVYAQADVALMCSPAEAMGRVTAEALCCGLPVIGYAGGATPELIQHGKTGFLYRTTEELAKYMCLLAENKTLTDQMSKAAKEYGLWHFSQEKYVLSIWQILQKVTKL